MTRQDQQQPWWERPARTPGEPRYVREREQFRAELARARRADRSLREQSRTRAQFVSRSRSAA
jgi:hypothetical protein